MLRNGPARRKHALTTSSSQPIVASASHSPMLSSSCSLPCTSLPLHARFLSCSRPLNVPFFPLSLSALCLSCFAAMTADIPARRESVPPRPPAWLAICARGKGATQRGRLVVGCVRHRAAGACSFHGGSETKKWSSRRMQNPRRGDRCLRNKGCIAFDYEKKSAPFPQRKVGRNQCCWRGRVQKTPFFFATPEPLDCRAPQHCVGEGGRQPQLLGLTNAPFISQTPVPASWV